MATRDITRLMAELKRNHGKFYVYVLIKPNGDPFYVGYGISGVKPRERILQHEAEAVSGYSHPRQNHHKLNTIRAILATGQSVTRQIFSWHVLLADAKWQEVELIARFGRADLGTGPLTNMTAGGDGSIELSPEGKIRMHAGQKKGSVGRVKWAKENPELQSAQGKHLAAGRKQWAEDHPLLDFAARSQAGQIGGRVSAERLLLRPDLRKEMGDAAGRASREWAKANPDDATANGKKAYGVGIGAWAVANPELAQEKRLKGLKLSFDIMMAKPGEFDRRMGLKLAAAKQWRADNPEKMTEFGNRQGRRNKRKAEIRAMCLALLRHHGIKMDLPLGTRGLAVWEEVLVMIQKIISK